MTRVVFFGSSTLSVQILELLLSSPEIQIVAVVTKATPIHGHARSQDTPVAQVAQTHALPLFRPNKANDVIEDLSQLKADVAVLFAYGQILSDSLRQIFPHGIVNVHPSLLPLYRGPSPIEAMLLAGDTEVGTSIMLLDSGMDTGPLLSQKSFTIEPRLSKAELTSDLMTASSELLLPTLFGYLEGTINPQPQDESRATICRLITKHDGEISLFKESIQTFDRKVRAYANWPTVSIGVIQNEKPTRLQIHAGHIEDVHPHSQPSIQVRDKQLMLELVDGTYVIEQAQLPGRAIVSGRDLANGQVLSLQTSD